MRLSGGAIYQKFIKKTQISVLKTGGVLMTDANTEPKLVHHEKKSKVNVWMITTAVITVLLLVSIFTSGFKSFESVSKQEASDKVVKYIEANVQGAQVTANAVNDLGSFYAINLSLNGQAIESYITKDGKMLFPYAIPLDTAELVDATNSTPSTPVELTKSDKPEVELFVMSHCPFGTQIEKGMIPAAEALGDSIDFKIRFVYYAMHGEKEVNEELNQYCIQKEQNDKFIPYLECFLKDGNGTACLAETKVDADKLGACVKSTDAEFKVTANLKDESSWLSGRYPKVDLDKALNDKYGVGGSPTLVINGAEVSSGRDSASLLKTICGAFNAAPDACSKNLSSASPSAGFGYTAASGASTGSQCGG